MVCFLMKRTKPVSGKDVRTERVSGTVGEDFVEVLPGEGGKKLSWACIV
jgi:hypothetical protein